MVVVFNFLPIRAPRAPPRERFRNRRSDKPNLKLGAHSARRTRESAQTHAPAGLPTSRKRKLEEHFMHQQRSMASCQVSKTQFHSDSGRGSVSRRISASIIALLDDGPLRSRNYFQKKKYADSAFG
jgi:hypothetical protein